MTQKERAKWSVHLETIKKCYRDLAQQLHKKRGAVPLRKGVKHKRKKCGQSTQHNCKNGSTMTQKKVLMWIVHLETMEKRYRNVTCVTVTPEKWDNSAEKMIEKLFKNMFHTAY